MQQMEAELSANATLKINLHLLTRILKERKHEKHSGSQYTTFGNVEIKRFWHFVTFSIFNTAYKNDLLLEVVVHDS